MSLTEIIKVRELERFIIRLNYAKPFFNIVDYEMKLDYTVFKIYVPKIECTVVARYEGEEVGEFIKIVQNLVERKVKYFGK